MFIIDNPVIMILVFITSCAFTAVAATVPPSSGAFMTSLFVSSMAAFLGGEEDGDEHEQDLEDADI